MAQYETPTPESRDQTERIRPDDAVDRLERSDAAAVSPSSRTLEDVARDRLCEDDSPVRQQETLDAAVAKIRSIKNLEPDEWRGLDRTSREWALRHASGTLRDTYNCPDPPIIFGPLPEGETRRELGNYSDGDYRVILNEKLLLSSEYESPEAPLEAMCHEYRHAYQHEMALRLTKGQFLETIPDRDKAAEWQENIRHYHAAEEGFTEYEKQAMERDSRTFAAKIRERVYARSDAGSGQH